MFSSLIHAFEVINSDIVKTLEIMPTELRVAQQSHEGSEAFLKWSISVFGVQFPLRGEDIIALQHHKGHTYLSIAVDTVGSSLI